MKNSQKEKKLQSAPVINGTSASNTVCDGAPWSKLKQLKLETENKSKLLQSTYAVV